MKTTVLAVVGSKSSGKTATIEILTKELTKKGYRVAAVKHIAEPDFTIDREGKDTWRFAQSGARTVVAVATSKVAIIEKIDRSAISLEKILQACGDNDAILLEGFKELVGRNLDIPKIVATKSAQEAFEASRNFKPILAFTSLYPMKVPNLDVPCIDVMKNREKIVDIVEKNVREQKNNNQN